jgi:hypothetical protein
MCLCNKHFIDSNPLLRLQAALALITDQQDLLSQLNELSVKPPAEALATLSQLSSHLGEVPLSACLYKVLPSVARGQCDIRFDIYTALWRLYLSYFCSTYTYSLRCTPYTVPIK